MEWMEFLTRNTFFFVGPVKPEDFQNHAGAKNGGGNRILKFAAYFIRGFQRWHGCSMLAERWALKVLVNMTWAGKCA